MTEKKNNKRGRPKKLNEYGLTELEERFCQEYLKDLNGTQAYLRTGYKCQKDSAKVNSCRLLAKPEIQERISQLMEERSKRTKIEADRVLQEIAKIAFANIGLFADFDADGVTLKSSSELTEEQLSVISSVSETPLKAGGKAVRIKLHDKTRNLEMLMRHLGLFNDKLNLQAQVKVLYNIIGCDNLEKPDDAGQGKE